MARRRKEEKRNQAGKRRRPSDSEDTNVEILQAKRPAAERNHHSQPLPLEKITGKKRKRLNKYIENKLRKEESSAIIKKLSERMVDTSYLQSTKTIGQRKEAKQTDERRQNVDILENKNSVQSGSEEDEGDNGDCFASVRMKHPSPVDLKVPQIGVALKTSSQPLDGHNPSIRKKLKPENKPSWRQRLHDTHLTSKIMDNEYPDGNNSSQSSGNDEYSEWSGFSSDDSGVPDPKDELLESKNGVNLYKGSDRISETEVAEHELGAEGERAQQRAKYFKLWAREQSGLGGSPSNISSLPRMPPMQREVAAADFGSQRTPPISSSNDLKSRQSYFVTVRRSPVIQEARMSLPIIVEEQQIMEIVNQHDYLIVCGQTGSGKTTQVPQFLYEAGYGAPDSDRPGMIGVTQPRRVAAVSMSSRVAEELGPEHGMRVGYQIRFDTNVRAETAIKFMTDGILLREVSIDFLLSKYSVIIIDEAHERSINTDSLIGVLSRVVKLRREMSEEDGSKVKPLKLIIMSATMRVADFTANNRLFPESPPVINVNARQYPVIIHFNKRTALTNYVDEAFQKVSKIHQKLPPGGILVFLTGQNEIRILYDKLRHRFPIESGRRSEMNDWNPKVKCPAKYMDVEIEDVEIEQDVDTLNVVGLDEDLGLSDELEDEEFDTGDSPLQAIEAPLHVLPLYSLLPVTDQLRVFQSPPDGSRLCVVATNVAETSLTIPGIKYVVDCGRVKERVYDKNTGVESFQIGWISKASAAQRSGRAGRTGPGHCYRLYSSAVFERDFPQFSEPEILKYPIEGIVLQMKGMHIDKVINFPFPTPPDRESLRQAEKLLENLGALDKDLHITTLGESMSAFPLLPRYSKMIILGQQFGNMQYVIAIVAGLSVGDPFLSIDELEGLYKDKLVAAGTSPEAMDEVLRSKRRKHAESREQFSALDPSSDVIKLLCAIGAYECGGASDIFCEENFLRVKQMRDIRRLRIQITNLVNNQLAGVIAPVMFSPNLPPPSPLQIRTLKQVVTAAYLDQIAIRLDLVETNISRRSTIDPLRAEYLPLTSPAGHLRESARREVHIHPNSALAKLATAPDYIIYSDLRDSQNNGRLRLMPLTTVMPRDIEPLAKGTPFIQYSKPLNYPPPRVFSEDGVMKKETYVVPRFGIEGKGWELPSIKRVEILGKH